MSAATQWSEALAAWAIPPEIIAQAPQSPWIHPPANFVAPRTIAQSPSHARAREALGPEGTVLDVGCGGGIAAFALVPMIRHATGVDQQAEMLEMFDERGCELGITTTTVLGDWPAQAPTAGMAEVVTCHHVVYNVGEIVPFLQALNDAATARVVIEMPMRHPLSNLDAAWQHFWNLPRPSGPTPNDLVAVLSEMGITASSEEFVGELRDDQSLSEAAHFTRIRLCLPVEREGEVFEFLSQAPAAAPRELATIWWDV